MKYIPIRNEGVMAVRYCPMGEVAYVDTGHPEKTFPARPEMYGRQVPVGNILNPTSRCEVSTPNKGEGNE